MDNLDWLPYDAQWNDSARALAARGEPGWQELVALSRTRLDFMQTNRLDKLLGACHAKPASADALRLAVLGSFTVDHLFAGIRVGGLRRGLAVTTYATGYNQYMNEVLDTMSALHAFAPNALLFAFDAKHLLGTPKLDLSRTDADQLVERAVEQLRSLWRQARLHFNGPLIQQTLLPIGEALLGSNEQRLPAAPLRLIQCLNAALRDAADDEGVDLLALDQQCAQLGLAAWHDPKLWHRAKQYVSPLASPLYGELVARLLAARRGRSAKCLVLDLDNTLWGGVIGDDGLDGIVLGQGNASGEAFAAFQQYCKALLQRGVILAVCSKNDEANALAPFTSHPEMVLKREDIACFVANWDDKATNLRRIAQQLNIGIDALVFVDDNPFERDLVRRELPMVAVPELPKDPALYADCVARGGYFESTGVTDEDRERGWQYQANLQREAARTAHVDLGSYLRSLDMVLEWTPFDTLNLQRIVQLINKTNQFNLTTQRQSEDEVRSRMADPRALLLQFRLKDRFGDNGIIAIVTGRFESDAPDTLHLDTWLMSCRVLGRLVEEASLNVVMAEAARLGARHVSGEYRPSEKNQMVCGHYEKLGFAPRDGAHAPPAPATGWLRAVDGFTPFPISMNINRV
ncbi:HAD-IIIC family phosphatase [Paraburkholderia sediminicola]|uniref:HAD-IIIC family phosphatase n=1 Tax=Paraburkholderia sediminicola TaxID=458836 RepID=UPI0038BD890A